MFFKFQDIKKLAKTRVLDSKLWKLGLKFCPQTNQIINERFWIKSSQQLKENQKV